MSSVSEKKGVSLFQKILDTPHLKKEALEKGFTTEQFKELADRSQVYAKTLPYEDYYEVSKQHLGGIPEDNWPIYVLADGSISKMFLFKPIVLNGSDQSELNNIVKKLESSFQDIPNFSEFAFQFIIQKDNNVNESVVEYLSEGRGARGTTLGDSGNSVSKQISENIENLSKVGVISQLRYYITLTLKPLPEMTKSKRGPANKGLSLSFLKKDGKESEEFSDAWGKQLDKMLKASNAIVAAFEGHFSQNTKSRSSVEDVRISRFIELMFSILNPEIYYNYIYDKDRYQNPITKVSERSLALDSDLQIRDQLVQTAPMLYDDHMELGEYKYKSVAAKQLPEVVSFYGIWEVIKCINTPFLMALNFHAINKSFERVAFDYKIGRLRRLVGSEEGSDNDITGASAKSARKEKLRAYEDTLSSFNSKEHMLKLSLITTLMSNDDEDLRIAEEELSEKLRSLDYIPIVENSISPFVIRETLPFCHYPELDRFISRSIRVFSNNVCNQLPIAGYWQSQKGRALMYPSREGGVVLYDFFADADAPHFVIVGATGTGKSFSANYVLSQYMRYNPYMFIIDLGGSYKKMTELYPDSSEYIGLDIGREDLCVNPFIVKPYDRDETGRGTLSSGLKFQLIDEYGFEVSVSGIRNLNGDKELIFQDDNEEGIYGATLKDEVVIFKNETGHVNSDGDIELTSGDTIVMASDKKLSAVRMEYFKALLGEMISQGDEKYEVDRIEGNFLGLAINAVFEKDRSRKYLLVTDFIEELQRKDNEKYIYQSSSISGHDVALKLMNYSLKNNGEFGKLIDRKPTVNFDKRLVVFEIQGIATTKCKTVVLLAIMNLIRNNVMARDKRHERKIFVMDEAWNLLGKSRDISAFVEKAYREFRKYGCSVGCISQSINDIADVAGGILVQQSPTKMYMGHGKTGAELAAKVVRELTKEDVVALQSLELKMGLYSEMLLTTPRQGSVVCRVMTPPAIYWMATTKSHEVAMWNRMLIEKGSPAAAIDYLCALYPSGMPSDNVEDKDNE